MDTGVLPPPVHSTAIYARLSVEDNGCESDSIENQIALLEKYVANHHQLALISTFYDNGATGTNFDRAGFTAMLDEVKKGRINCIVVKDLSRFGRNYMETGNYLEKIFPCLGVRFISVNDNYDSISVTANEALALSLKNVCHHIYAKDISRKICTVFEAKKKHGLFLGRFAPYGYRKAEGNKYKLEIEAETAGVVRDIFGMRLAGMGVASIARTLNDKGIASYYKLLFERGLVKGTRKEAAALWSGGSVTGVLQNPIYCGGIVERKGEYAYYKGIQKHEIPQSEWNYIENTHDAIIDRATFEQVRQLIGHSKQAVKDQKKQTSHRQRTENILRGLLICGHCKKKMLRDGGDYNAEGKLLRHRFRCSGKYQKSDNCKSLSVTESQLVSTVLELVKLQLDLLADTGERMNASLKPAEYEKQSAGAISKERNLETQLLQIKSRIEELYHGYKQGLLPESAYVFAQSKCEREQCELERKLEALREKELLSKKRTEPEIDRTSKLFFSRDENAPSREICLALFENIVVYDDHIAVHYTFQSGYEEMSSSLPEHAEAGAVP